MAASRIQVTGICRWSYPSAPGAFRQTPEDIQAARDMLYGHSRMEHRLFLLEELVLPSLRRQTDQDFTLVFLMGADLPEPYRSRLLELLTTVPQILPVFEEAGQRQQRLVRRILSEHRTPDVEAVAEFRLDDDDAVAIDFVEETRRIFEDIRPLFHQRGVFAIDYTRGMIMSTSGDACEFTPLTARWWAPGLAVFVRPDMPRSVLDFHHMRLWHRMHTLMYTDKAMFIRGVHHTNDSSIEEIGKRSGFYRLSPQQKKRILVERFALDPGRIRRTWKRRHAEFTNAPVGKPPSTA